MWVFAQERVPTTQISFKAQYGMGLNSSSNRLYGGQIRLIKDISQSEQDWARILQAKRVSYGLSWHNLDGLKERINGVDYPGGMAFAASTEVDFQLLKLGKLKLFATPGIGLAYLSETIFTQPATKTIGSHMNLMLTGELGLEYPLSSRTAISAGSGIQHFSNTGISIPNGGWNSIVGNIAVKTGLPGVDLHGDRIKENPHLQRNNIEVWLGMGARGKYRTKDKKFLRTGMYAGYNYYLNPALSLKMGSHLVYYHTVYDPRSEGDTFQYYGSSFDRVRWGLATGVDVSMNRLVFNLMYGKYLHYNSAHHIQWYWVTGLRYYLSPNIGFQFTINLHRAQSDYANWGLIFRL